MGASDAEAGVFTGVTAGAAGSEELPPEALGGAALGSDAFESGPIQTGTVSESGLSDAHARHESTNAATP
jgi:hypothetical protein